MKKASEEMASEVHKLYDESDGLKKRVGFTADRLKAVETQFEEDQKSIDEVCSVLTFQNRKTRLINIMASHFPNSRQRRKLVKRKRRRPKPRKL